MSTLSYKPLRKSVELTHITDEEIIWKLKNREISREYLQKNRRDSVTITESPGGCTIVPEARGRIADILFTVPAHYDQKKPGLVIDPLDEKHFTTLIGHLSAERRHYTILCHASQVDQIKGWFRERNISEEDVLIGISVFNFSIWAQDAYVALNNKKGEIMLSESICFTRDHDMSVADDLSLQTEIRAQQSHLYFQGGNILETEKYVLVGMDYIRENEGRPFLEDQEAVCVEFEKLFGKKILPVGRTSLIPHRHRQYLGGGVFQPVFHIDMYITPTGLISGGKELLLVGSPRLARDILGEEQSENDFDVYFDEVADALSGEYEVKRMPLLPTQYKSREAVFPRHYYLSYNNVLVENYQDGQQTVMRNVYLPTYRDQVKTFVDEYYLDAYYGSEARYARLDAGAKKIWEDLGFKVFEMDALEDLAMSWGSVHCMVKTLKRE